VRGGRFFFGLSGVTSRLARRLTRRAGFFEDEWRLKVTTTSTAGARRALFLRLVRGDVSPDAAAYTPGGIL